MLSKNMQFGLMIAAIVVCLVLLLWRASEPAGRPATVALVPAACPVLKEIGMELELSAAGCKAKGHYLRNLFGGGGQLTQGNKQFDLSGSQIAAMAWN